MCCSMLRVNNASIQKCLSRKEGIIVLVLMNISNFNHVSKFQRHGDHFWNVGIAIIEAIGLSYMQSARFSLRNHQSLVWQDVFLVMQTKCPSLFLEMAIYQLVFQCSSRAEEADMRIWRHVTVANAQRILIYSPDTDVYNIGVAVANKLSHVIVQINVVYAREQKYIHIQNLVKVLESDPDIASIPQDNLSTIFHMLYVVSGCDYISISVDLEREPF